MRLGSFLLVGLLMCMSLAGVGACGASSDSSASPPTPDAEAGPPIQLPPDADVDADDGGGDAGSGGLDLSSVPKGLYETEDQIAVAPDGTIGVMWTTFAATSEGMTYRFSTDDGKTFSAAGSFSLPDGLLPGDPAITADDNGNFWAAFLGIHYNGTDVDYIRIYAAKAPKGSTTFGTPVEVSDPLTTKFHDHPKVFATKAGTILVAFMESDTETSATATGISATSTNGTDWTRHTLIAPPDSSFANLFSMCEGTSGIYAAFFQIGAGAAGYGIGIRKSIDEGASWTKSTPVSLDSETPAGLDMRCAASGNDVWVAYATTQTPSSSELTLDLADGIIVAHSANGGTSFTEHAQALDTNAAAGATLPEFVREDDGSLDVAYIAGAKEGDSSGSIRFTRKAGGGAFGASTEVDGPMRFTLSRTSEAWLGDYFGFAVHGHALYVAYPRNETGHTHIFFKKVPLP